MNKQALESFMQQLQQDAELQQAIRTEFSAEAAAGVPFEKVLELAGRHGYTLPVEELEGELEDADLDAVSAGSFNSFIKIDASFSGDSFSLYSGALGSTSLRDYGSNLFLKLDG